MQQTTRQNSIISYSGLSREALITGAKQAYLQAEGHRLPARFAAFFPLFPFELIQNMPYVGQGEGNGARVAPSGFSTDPADFHRLLYQQMPDVYQGDNALRLFDYEGNLVGRGVCTVDEAWATRFPQYGPFMGEKLMLHLLGGGHQAVLVPESVFPRSGGLLRAVERQLQVTHRAQHFVQYAKGRIAGGDTYDPEAFGADYLKSTGLEPLLITQRQLSRVMQDRSIAQNLQNETTSLFTENAKRVENLRQYVPYHYAPDTFEPASITRQTARLFQPCMEGSGYISDLWLPYQELAGYMDKEHNALDMARLCEGYQMSPLYCPKTGGGLYPDGVLVVQVRDRELPAMVSDVLNNPAYGGGMNPQGMLVRQVYIPDSREMIRQRKLVPEATDIVVNSQPLSPAAFRRSQQLACLQEAKGRLVDAMYRREAALSQFEEGTPAYEKAKAVLDEKVRTRQKRVDREAALWKNAQMSGYDADIDYLRRKQQHREAISQEEAPEPVAFSLDPQREQSIESGYAMRGSAYRVQYKEVYVPPQEEQSAPGLEAETEQPSPKEERIPSGKDAAQKASVEATPQPIAGKANPVHATAGEEGAKAAVEAEQEASLPSGDAAGPEAAPRSGEEEPGESPSSEASGEEAGQPSRENTGEAGKAPEGQDTEEAPGPPADVPPHQPVTLQAVAPKGEPHQEPVKPKLAYIVRRESEPRMTTPVNRGGKMASLLRGKGPGDGEPAPQAPDRGEPQEKGPSGKQR